MSESYVIITPAYNEARYIEMTIESVLAQTVKPIKWVIVDDGSTDETGSRIQRYAAQYPWIEYLRREKIPGQLYYASNVYAIFEGLAKVEGLLCNYIAILDADISLPPNYYEQILSRLVQDKKLGIASGVVVDHLPDGRYRRILMDRRTTPKAIMIFRSICYREIGGFLPLKYGGEDTCACFAARMKGWKVWSFPDIVAIHNRPDGSGHSKHILKNRFRQGFGEYFLAVHPVFFLMKTIRRCIIEKPIVVGGAARLIGYLYACCRGEQRQIPEELVRYIRREQFGRVLGGNRIPKQDHVIGF